MMKKSKIFIAGALLLLATAGLLINSETTAQSFSSSRVPTEYFANYKIQKDRARLLEIFVDIDAENKI